MNVFVVDPLSPVRRIPSEPIDEKRFAAMCKALAHPIRVRIVTHLAGIDGCVCGQIVQILPLAQSTVSQHLKILKACGLVQGRIDGPRTCYCLDRQLLEQFKQFVKNLG